MWYQFDSGKTIGSQGSESGKILKDDEHESGARITLESDAAIAPYAITCGVYGWMFHTRFFEKEEEAIHDFQRMKNELSRILDLIPSDPELETKIDSVRTAIDNFVEEFP